ncbi:hypothetical protein QBC45DRAFT_336933 [Copromyces sp. CBS 386.78]|nr:hypothetical protein QBC45DRAFT_336933 [Copromyces sp. CBS 386.78]
MATTTPNMDTQAPSPQSYLTRMPQEVLTRITYFVRTPDLCNARLTCRSLENALYYSFAYEFFRKKQFMIYGPSLQVLVDISKHPSLSHHLKHVIIGTDQIIPPNRISAATDDQKSLNWHLAYADQQTLLVSGRARDMLVEAFKNLRHLETVDLRDFHSSSRTRDGNATWSSYGHNTLLETTGVKPFTGQPRAGEEDYPTRLFALITHALAAAKARPPGIEVVIRENWAVRDHGFLVPTYLEPDLLPVLTGLKKLHVVLDINKVTYGDIDIQYLFFKKFLAFTPNLTWLRINFRRSTSYHGEEEALLKWLASSLRPGTWSSPGLINADPSRFPPPVELHHLEQLDIGQLSVSANTLTRLFRKFSPTLKVISLRRVKLQHNSDQHSFDMGDDEQNPWIKLLRSLKKDSFPNLRELSLSLLDAVVRSNTSGATLHYPVVGFVNPDQAEKQNGISATGYQDLEEMVKVIKDRTYTGLKLEAFLNNPTADIATPSKHITGVPTRGHSSDNESDFDSMDDDEEESNDDDGSAAEDE